MLAASEPRPVCRSGRWIQVPPPGRAAATANESQGWSERGMLSNWARRARQFQEVPIKDSVPTGAIVR